MPHFTVEVAIPGNPSEIHAQLRKVNSVRKFMEARELKRPVAGRECGRNGVRKRTKWRQFASPTQPPMSGRAVAVAVSGNRAGVFFISDIHTLISRSARRILNAEVGTIRETTGNSSNQPIVACPGLAGAPRPSAPWVVFALFNGIFFCRGWRQQGRFGLDRR